MNITVIVYKVNKKIGYSINYIFSLKNITVYISLSSNFYIYVYDYVLFLKYFHQLKLK